MPTLCSKLANGFLDFLDLGPVGIGLRHTLGGMGRAVGGDHSGRRLFCNISLFPAGSFGLAEAPVRHHAVGFARCRPAPHHCFEE